MVDTHGFHGVPDESQPTKSFQEPKILKIVNHNFAKCL